MATDAEIREQAMAHVYRQIDRARVAWRCLDMVDGMVRTLIVCGGALIAALWADNLLHLPPGVRLALAVGLLALLGLLGLRLVLYPLVRPLTDEMVAAHVERGLPELENRLINSVQLYNERFGDSLTRMMVNSQLRYAAAGVREGDLTQAGQTKRLWKHARWMLVIAAVLVAYGLLFSGYLGNAFVRLVRPFGHTPPITDTRLDVRPGDANVLQGDSLPVEARVSGVLPESAQIQVDAEGGERSGDPMAFEGNAFTHTFANIQRVFRYRVKAGDALTRWFNVSVQSRPAVSGIDLTYTYPTYTGLPEKTETGAVGDIRAPVGTTARLRVTTDRPVRNGRLEVTYLTPGGPDAPRTATVPLVPDGQGALQAEMRIDRSGRYTIRVEDEAGIPNIPRVRHIVAEPDAAPRVHFVKPGADVSVGPDAQVTLLAAAEDDFGLVALHLFVQSRAGGDWQKIRSWDMDAGTRVAREGAVLNLQQMGVRVGATIAYYMQANDGLRRQDEESGRSRIYHVRVVDAEHGGAADQAAREALADVVKRLIQLQKANLAATRALDGWANEQEELDEDGKAWTDFRGRARPLVTTEEDIYTQAGDAVRAYAGEETSSMAEALGRVAAGPIAQAVDLLKALHAADLRESVETRASSARQKQAEVIAMLEQLLADPAALLAKMLADEGQSEELDERLDEVVTGQELAEKLRKALDDFADDQKRIIELTNQLAEKPVDDFTDEDEKKLQEIIDKENEWTKFFQEAATDLSKLPPQDFSLANQAKEFLEVYSEVQFAAEEAERKQIELAVPHEQAALELAESIETNLEKWLMEDKDNILWSMEEPMEEFDVPLVELPDELQDLIGDLVESEEDMLEEFDDVTSGWMDSLDVGAGWDTTDGPISNMSAKGITGNRLPNTSEIGGRSGEGRTGKSSGQFVEESASGKGGRQTPSRLTADPFEAGWVDDTSAESPSGSTGGGKVSGQGAEGFQGPTPPALQQQLKRLSIKQQDLIDQAKRLDFGLKKYRHPRGRLPEAIELMQTQKADLDRGELSNFGSYQRIVISNLREVKELTEKQKQLVRDRSSLLPKQVRDEIAASQTEKVPDQYREMVRNYFRALSEAGTERR